jgi:hypothetical protein
MKLKQIGLLAALASAGIVPAHAQTGVAITEVAPWSSGDSPVGHDWFELTNTGAAAISLSGWSMDDSSATPGVAALSGVTSIAAGQSAIFIESDGSDNATFIDTWFGGNAPAGFLIGNYQGSGVGLSTGGDAVNVFDGAGVLQASVNFGASSVGQTFDNAAGINGTISQLSMVGVNGAFVAAHDASETGSPGTIAAVPEPASVALMLAGLGLVGAAVRRRHA